MQPSKPVITPSIIVVICLGLILGVVLAIGTTEISKLNRAVDLAAADVITHIDRANELEAEVEQQRQTAIARDAEIAELLDLLVEQQEEIERLEAVADLLSPPVDATTPIPEPTPTAEHNTSIVPAGADCDPAMVNCWLDGQWLCGEHAVTGPCTPQRQCPGFEHECWLHCEEPLNPVRDCYAFDPEELSENP